MVTLRAAHAQPESPWCLKRRGQRAGVKWDLSLQQAPSAIVVSKKQTHTYQMKATDSESDTKLQYKPQAIRCKLDGSIESSIGGFKLFWSRSFWAHFQDGWQ